MARLHYENLGVHRPDILMRMSVSGLKIFYDFLSRTKRHMESDAAVMRLAWSPGVQPDDEEDEQNLGERWIRLVEPEDCPDEPEATFRAFFDDNVREVYERGPADERRKATLRPRDGISFNSQHRIRVLDRHPETRQLCVGRLPAEDTQLLLRPNTWSIECQRRALRALQNAPQRDHLPLLRLFESLDHARWEPAFPDSVEATDWTVLTDIDRPGTDEQRRFVNIALGTPDFAFLEGPPGSGKTTAICELIVQLARRGKRVLLCGSTHVAVDNVLERLMDEANPHRDLVIPVRVGDRRNISERARPWQIDVFVRTERDRILDGLDRAKPRTSSQEALRELLRQGNDIIERMVLDAANLVCGTTIGILQHPDMRERGKQRRSADPEFDFLIVDEASKTPFQEFLVPALWAKRWIVVGDPKQLSPFVDDEAMAVNIEACLPDKDLRNACVDAFLAANPRRPRVAAVAADFEETKRAYIVQGAARGVALTDADLAEHADLWAASIVVGGTDSLERRIGELPLDVTTVRADDGVAPLLRRRVDAWQRLSGPARDEQPEWASEVGWRLARWYEQRFTGEVSGPDDGHRKSTAQRLEEEVDDLLPAPGTTVDREAVWRDIDRVRRVALPSVLESLRYGFERDKRQKRGTALSDGLPGSVLGRRRVLLTTQHRMHPEIAEFSHVHVYGGQALRTPEYMERERRWSYRRYAQRAVWIDVPAADTFRNNRNGTEARRVIAELRHFDDWAETNHPHGSVTWEVAVLAFYRGQEREIRDRLRRWTNLSSAMRHFHRGPRERPHMTIELCTVDRFQGHEADFVLISFANRRPTSFLESPNRLNVALTRARYQRVVFGDRRAMRRARDGALRKFAQSERWEEHIERTGP